MYVVKVNKTGYVDKQGHRRELPIGVPAARLPRRRHGQERTVANLSALPGHVIDLVQPGNVARQQLGADRRWPPSWPEPSPGTTVSIGLYLPGRHANAGHCLKLHTVTGKVHPNPADPQVSAIAS